MSSSHYAAQQDKIFDKFALTLYREEPEDWKLLREQHLCSDVHE